MVTPPTYPHPQSDSQWRPQKTAWLPGPGIPSAQSQAAFRQQRTRGIVVCAVSPAQEAEAGGCPRVQGQSGLYRDLLREKRDRGREGNRLGTGSVPGAMKTLGRGRRRRREARGLAWPPALTTLSPYLGLDRKHPALGFHTLLTQVISHHKPLLGL